METDLVSFTEFTQRETAAKEYFSAANKARDDVDAVRSNIAYLTPLTEDGSVALLPRAPSDSLS
jgi:hypothetical protein